MDRAELIQFINSKIIPNQNREITGQIMNIVLNAIVSDYSKDIGSLSSLNSEEKENLVKAINEIINTKVNNIELGNVNMDIPDWSTQLDNLINF